MDIGPEDMLRIVNLNRASLGMDPQAPPWRDETAVQAAVVQSHDELVRYAERRAVERFLDWLYEEGPALDEVPRAWMMEAYEAARAEAGTG